MLHFLTRFQPYLQWHQHALEPLQRLWVGIAALATSGVRMGSIWPHRVRPGWQVEALLLVQGWFLQQQVAMWQMQATRWQIPPVVQ